MTNPLRKAVLLAALAASVAATHAQAAAIDELHAFLTQTTTARGHFDQSTQRGKGGSPQRSSGSFEFQRPGRFEWTYEKPYEQRIVADGEKLYFYDKDLNQVTVKRLSGALPSSPASILFGANDFEREFDVKDAGTRDGLSWIDAKPKAKDSPFDRIEIGFRDGLPASMRLTDTLGSATQLTLSAVEKNAKVDPANFRFTPPAGADVLEDK